MLAKSWVCSPKDLDYARTRAGVEDLTGALGDFLVWRIRARPTSSLVAELFCPLNEAMTFAWRCFFAASMTCWLHIRASVPSAYPGQGAPHDIMVKTGPPTGTDKKAIKRIPAATRGEMPEGRMGDARRRFPIWQQAAHNKRGFSQSLDRGLVSTACYAKALRMGTLKRRCPPQAQQGPGREGPFCPSSRLAIRRLCRARSCKRYRRGGGTERYEREGG